MLLQRGVTGSPVANFSNTANNLQGTIVATLGEELQPTTLYINYEADRSLNGTRLSMILQNSEVNHRPDINKVISINSSENG